ncbi:ABC transporter ATP-binding protein [Polaribacter reichenbachii]|uniref:ABC transporter ATP-binding protein n=1 Tax=Polaribacter reichenbachii TaxID=996801 RepID=A0A1B8TPS4_9FLAO|nr:ABC transporter ATP-binding protein [Polaribacter reichenbachii]APZ46860.1 ABC transporter ATP-binding protein [Polaribacter reichenbachii]AUC17503.1 ABC transporter ATP-binding protein [Polaribacter reichenbachii]OBY61622.1 ABC transporter ATP-binding protein [Polaribacter reichenbachii]
MKHHKNIILKTENLSIGYQDKKAQNIVASNIDITIEKGKLVTVLGKNGIGKSTLLRTVSKVQKALKGEVFINQKNIENFTNKELSTVLSLVLTERLPESQITVFELIALGRQPYTNWIDKLSENDLEKINWAIDQTEIYHLKEKFFYELSDGQLQRVLIARALAQDTDLIILDEPTAHLDLHHTIKIFDLLQKLINKTSKTIILSSHEVNLSIKFADEIILFTDEKIHTGTPLYLMETGAFDNLFPSDIVNFNRKLEQFIINKP